jgi:hypothetical protein
MSSIRRTILRYRRRWINTPAGKAPIRHMQKDAAERRKATR